MSIQKLLSRKSIVVDPISSLAEKVGSVTTSRTFTDEKLAGMAISTEGFDSNSEQILTNVYNSFESTLKTITQDFNVSAEAYQLEAATIGGILGTNPRVALSSKLNMNTQHTLVPSNLADGFAERPIALEAYDERDNRNSQTYSIIFNLLASRQDDFGETFFPTIVVNPNEVGVTISAKVFYTYNDLKRSVTGSLARYARRNVIRAYADASILRNELTRVVPVIRVTGAADDNSDKFLDTAEVAPWSEDITGTFNITTSALRVGRNIDLMGISQTNELLNSGVMGPSDTLDTYIRLSKLFIRITEGLNTDIIAIDTENVPSSNFTYAPQGNYRRMILNLDSDGFVISGDTRNVNGVAVSTTTLPELLNRKARINLTANGVVILDKADCVVNAGTVDFITLRDAAGNMVTGAPQTSLSNKLASAAIVGYQLTAYRANSNLRQRGKLVDSQIEYQILQLPYRSPLAVIMPAMNSGTEDTSALQTLITITGVFVSNEAVTSLIRSATELSAYEPLADNDGNLPEVRAIGRFYVKPAYFHEAMDLTGVVDSLKSHERIKDIRAAIVEKIRFYANEMYRASEYKAAALVLTGNAGYKPTVIVGTDPVLYNYIMFDGDLRTLGESFDVKVVSTLDTRVRNKIFVTFGIFDSSRNTSMNPLNFGSMLWSPELTIVMPVSRDGQTSKEMIVAPRFAHIMNLPVITELSVTGLPSVINKVPVFTNPQP